MKLFMLVVAVGFAIVGMGVSAQPTYDPEIWIAFLAMEAFSCAMKNYETPIEARFASLITATFWNSIATYSDSFKDALTNDRPHVVVQQQELYTTANRAQAAAHSSLYVMERLVTKLCPSVLPTFQSMGVPNIALGLAPELMTCEGRDGLNFDCLQHEVNSNPDVRIVGHAVALQVVHYAFEDGWNQLGKDDGSCNGSDCPAFQSPIKYRLKSGPKGWRPVVETDGLGYFTKQQHVTPHIGTTAKFRFLAESERKSRKVPKPQYSDKRIRESKVVLERMNGLNDDKKAQIEFFSRMSDVTGTLLYSFFNKCASEMFDESPLRSPDIGRTCSFERFVNFALALSSSEHDSAIIAWKEKVRHNLVRPTTAIRRKNGFVTTWAPYEDNNYRMRAKDFQTYSRLEPHAEYPSASSCFCQSLCETTNHYLNTVFGNKIMPISTQGSWEFTAGSSIVEPGKTPNADIVLQYASVNDLATACGESRLDAGMNFADSVPAGKLLCAGLGIEAADWAQNLYGPPE